MSTRKFRKKSRRFPSSGRARKASKKDRTHQRLTQLYEISKYLAGFESVEQAFPRILSLAAGAFPLLSAVLVEKRGNIYKTTIWPTTGLDDEQVSRAISHAREAYGVLTAATATESADLNESAATAAPLHGMEFDSRHRESFRNRFLVLPLVLAHEPLLGVLQMETYGPLDEEDLSFADALTNLIAVALHHHYVSSEEKERQKSEMEKTQQESQARSAKLFQSQGQVTDLETERALREKFVLTLSHDLRTPLTAAALNAQLIVKSPGSIENCQLLASRTVANLGRVTRMIGDLLDANRIRAGDRLRLELKDCDLRSIAIDTLGMLKAIYGDRFVLAADQREIRGHWSPDELRRMLENLLSNAVKYGSLHHPITVTLGQNSDRARIQVHNQGESIAPEDRGRIFRQFNRAGPGQTSSQSGWGLGLTLVQGVVEAHGGNITIESSAGLGTTFTVEIPNDSRPFQAEFQESDSA